MKFDSEFLTIIVALTACLLHKPTVVVAQLPNANQDLTPFSPAATSPDGAANSAPTSPPPSTLSVPPSQTQPNPPGQSPTPLTTTSPGTATPGGPTSTPAPTVTSPLPWSTQALIDEVILSTKEPETIVKKKRTIRLDDEHIAELRTKIARDDTDQKSRLRLAEYYEGANMPEKMIEVLRPAATTLQRKGMLMLARAYRMMKDHKEEIRALEILRSQRESDYFVHYALGVAYSQFGNRAAAVERLLTAKNLNPRYYPVYEALLRETKRDRRWTDAIAIAQDTASTFGNKAKYLSELCLLYAHQAYLDKALEVCRQAIAKDPKAPRNHVVLGLALKDKHGVDQATKVLKKTAQQFPKSEFAQWAYGELSWEKKNYPEALKYFRAAVKADPRSARSQIGLARSAFEERQYAEALPAFIQSCTLNRIHVQEFRKSASALRRSNNFNWHSKYEAGLGKCGVL